MFFSAKGYNNDFANLVFFTLATFVVKETTYPPHIRSVESL
jgi:hypothetical protein